LKIGYEIESIQSYVPIEAIELFSIYKNSNELNGYLSEISKMGIENVVFGYPQNFSKVTIKDLADALFLKGK
jgi:hypothetical protein